MFGVLAYSVQQRTRQFGVRIALGAGTWDVLRLVLGGAVRLTVAGAVIGLLLAAMLTQFIASLLFGVRPLDPVTFAGTAAVLVLAALAAAAAPAWHATGVDPATAFERRVMKRSLRSWLWRVPIDQEVEEELAFHLRDAPPRGQAGRSGRHRAHPAGLPGDRAKEGW